MNVKTLLSCLSLTFAVLLVGCAGAPLAKPEADTLAKLMKPAPDKAVIYLFRSQPVSAPWQIKVTLDGKDMGKTGADTYFRWSVEPGEHMIISYSETADGLVINAEPGHIYYVWQDIDMGFFQPRSRLRLVDRATAEIELEDCYLLEGKS
jgi:hypothetical protein